MPSSTCCRSSRAQRAEKGELTVDDSAIIGIIRFYTREAGVRSPEREISKLCRKAVKTLLMDKKRKHIEINGDNLKDYGRAAR